MGILIILALVPLIGFGLISAAVSSVVCAAAALIHGQGSRNALSYAGFGAVFGFFITPWTYVAGRALGKLLPPPLMVLVMAPPYVVWATLFALGGVGEIFYIWDVTTGFGGWQAPQANVVSASFVSLALAAIVIASLGACYFSIRGTYRRYNAERAASQSEHTPDWSYLTPFVYMYLWLIAGIFMALLVAQYAISIGVDIQGF